jgi:hypothetical protein
VTTCRFWARHSLVEFVPGRVLRSQADLSGVSDSEVAAIPDALLDVMISLHSVDPEVIGLGDLGRPIGFVDRQIGSGGANGSMLRHGTYRTSISCLANSEITGMNQATPVSYPAITASTTLCSIPQIRSGCLLLWTGRWQRSEIR